MIVSERDLHTVLLRAAQLWLPQSYLVYNLNVEYSIVVRIIMINLLT